MGFNSGFKGLIFQTTEATKERTELFTIELSKFLFQNSVIILSYDGLPEDINCHFRHIIERKCGKLVSQINLFTMLDVKQFSHFLRIYNLSICQRSSTAKNCYDQHQFLIDKAQGIVFKTVARGSPGFYQFIFSTHRFYARV